MIDANAAGWLTRLVELDPSPHPAIGTPAGEVSRARLRTIVATTVDRLTGVKPGDVAQLRFRRGDPRVLVAAIAVWTRGAVPLFQEADGSPTLAEAAASTVGAVVTVTAPDDHQPTPDRLSAISVQDRDNDRRVQLECDDPAYLISTSGSSGRPRVTLNTAAGLENTITALVDRYHLAPGCRALQFAPPSYDAWLADALPTLIVGGTLVYGQCGPWSSFRQVEEVIHAGSVTHAVLPPSMWRHLRLRTRLAVGVAAGEDLDAGTAARIRASADRVVNAYGPAEAAICTLTRELTSPSSAVCLGQALPGVHVDSVPHTDGTALLRIRGVGVAHGYVGESGSMEADRTHGWFGEDSIGRFFQTADIVEETADGPRFVGRADRTTKRHGRLLSLERIERALRSVPGAADCVAWIADDRIFCEYVPDGSGKSVGVADLHSVLEAWELPNELVPVPALRRSSSDKLDHRAQPRGPGPSSPVVAVWSDMVGDADEDRSFFASGDSLAAMELLERVAIATGVEVDIADFMDCPTLSRLRSLTEPGDQ